MLIGIPNGAFAWSSQLLTYQLWRSRVLTLALLAFVWLGGTSAAHADLVVMPTNLSFNLEVGQTWTVSRDITNTTGFTLQGTDFFGSFSGFSSDALLVNQVLGLTPITINDRTIARGVDLFSVQLGSGALAGQSYPLEFFFGDANGNFSAATTIVVTFVGAQQVSEPGGLALATCALFGLVASKRRRVAPRT